MSFAKKQTMNWDPATNQKLLLAILAHHGELKFDFKGIATLMGPTCSPRAVQEQIKKLRKDARAGFDETNQTFPGAQATPDKSASRKAPRAIAPAKLNSNAMQNKAATANNEPVNAKPKANEEDSCKKRKYNSPGALDVHTSFTTGNTMADVLYAAGVAYEEAA